MSQLKRLVVILALCTGCGPQKPDACHEGQVPTAVRTVKDPSLGYLLHTHAHNDYLHEHPLQDALTSGIHSVEADIWYLGSTLQVGHWPWAVQGTLETLYLDPLQALVDEKGSVYGDGSPFTLVIDIKERNPAYVNKLRNLLNGYSMLSRFSAGHEEKRTVTVVLTGDKAIKTRVVQSADIVPATRDGDYDLRDPAADPRWLHYAVDWKKWITWDGTDEIDAESARQLGCIMENAHALGRQVRMYNAPDNANTWGVLLRFGVDFINTDKLTELAAFLKGAP